MKKDWTEKDVISVLLNPIYTGVGPFPRIVEDKAWIRAAVKSTSEIGISETLIAVRRALLDSFGQPIGILEGPEWLDQSRGRVKKEGAEEFFSAFLKDIRSALTNDGEAGGACNSAP